MASSHQVIPNREAGGVLHNKTLSTGLKVLVSVFLVWFLLRQIGIGRIWELISNVDPWWCWIGAALFTASHFLGTIQWQWLLQSEGIDLPFGHCLSVYFIGLFFNNFLLGGVGGDVFRMLDIRRASQKGASAVSTVFLDRLIGLLAMSGISLISIPFALTGKSFGPALWIALAVLIGGWCLSLFFLFHKPFARFLSGLVQFWIPQRIKTKGREVYNKIHHFGRNRSLLIRVMCLSTVVQMARIFTHYLLARALGIAISPVYFFMIIPIVAMAASLPISIGGIGLREQTGVILLGAAGMTSAQAVSVEFLAYVMAIVISIPGGVVFVAGRRQR
jgi:uncharacterized protein (TIRG00374 family)